MSPTAPLPRRAFVGMLLAASLAPLGSTMIAVALPAIGGDLGFDRALLTQWLATSYLVVSMVCQPPGGRLGDRIGHRRNLWTGMLLYGCATTVGWFGPRLSALVVARVGMALGTALMVPSAVAQIRAQVTPERRSDAFGIFGATMGLAAAMGPLLGGELTDLFGWRAIFAAPLPQIAVAAWLVRGMPSPTPRTPLPFDLRRAFALVDFGVLRRRHFAAGGLVTACNNLAMYALLFQLPIYFAAVDPANHTGMGRTLLWLMLAMVVASPIGARVAARIGIRATVTIGVALELGALALLMNLTKFREPGDVAPALALLGAGIGLCSAPGQTAAMNAVAVEEAGIAAGMLATLRYLGGVLGIGVLGLMVRGAVGDELARHGDTLPVYVGALAVSMLAAQFFPGKVR